jgi:SNF family Na+-dependent transporter
MLLIAALTTAVAAVHALVVVFVDDLRDRRVAARRPLLAVGLFVLSGLLVVMAGGAAGS